jgi:HSP20 family protein
MNEWRIFLIGIRFELTHSNNNFKNKKIVTMTLVKVNNNLGRSFDGMMKELFNEFPTTVAKTFREDVLNFPPVNINETNDAYQVELSAPGFEKADFSINLESNILTISTEKKEEKKEENEKVIRKEFTYKGFKRSFTIDEKIDAENIGARYESGILKLTLPKKEIIKAGAKSISVL